MAQLKSGSLMHNTDNMTEAQRAKFNRRMVGLKAATAGYREQEALRENYPFGGKPPRELRLSDEEYPVFGRIGRTTNQWLSLNIIYMTHSNNKDTDD